MEPEESDIVTLEILSARMQLRGGDDPEAVLRAGEYVRDHVHDLAQRAPTAPSLQLVMLAAINIADELQRHSDREELYQRAEHKLNKILAKVQGAMR